MTILKRHRKQLDMLAKGLIEYETLSGQEIEDLLDGKVPLRD
jgi:cell division protease FtsH